MLEGSGTGARILLYSQDGFGLGHMRRANSIARGLLEARPDAAVLTVLDSPLGAFFQPGPGQDCVKLPSIVKVGAGVWTSPGLPLPVGDVAALRSLLLQHVTAGFKPDLMLVDHMPHGAGGELLPVLEQLRSGASSTRTVLGLRDIIDAPEVVHQVWTQEGAYHALEHFYDGILIYGRRDVFDPVKRYGFPSSVVARTHFTGYVTTPDRARYANRVRSRFSRQGGAERKLLVATAGGGKDGYPMMRAVLDALPILRAEHPWSAVLITGPFLPRDLRRDLERRGRAVHVTVKASVSDPLSYIDAADVVVGMAGYGSTMEALRSGTPFVLTPREGPSAEQRMRAGRFAGRGWAGCVERKDLGGEQLAAAVLAQIGSGRSQVRPPTDGLASAVSRLLAILDDRPAADSPTESADPAVLVPMG